MNYLSRNLRYIVITIITLAVFGTWLFTSTGGGSSESLSRSGQTISKSLSDTKVAQRDVVYTDESEFVQETGSSEANQDNGISETSVTSGNAKADPAPEIEKITIPFRNDPAQPIITDPRVSRVFGIGAPGNIEDLPDGNLKGNLLALTPENQAKAIEWLQSFSFSGLDAADSLRADKTGGIFYTCIDEQGDHQGCTHHSHHSAASVESTESIEEPSEPTPPRTAGASVPVSSPPVYNSKPGASKHIYLDFNGAYVTGKKWSETDGTTTWDTWDCAAWSSDGDTSTFSDSEQANIRRIWERVAEDYAPFDVNVTTDVTYDPDNYTGDKNQVGWLLITPTTDKTGARCPHYNSGGVAYVGVYGNNSYFSQHQPAWVTDMSVPNIAEAASHEMGHNMGLDHDGTSSVEYYGGHGSGAISWAPIMGSSYGENVTQWSKGEYYDSNRTEDDLSIISARVPYRVDDHGNDIAGATIVLPETDGSISQAGIIENTDDPDVFELTTGAGMITLNANSYQCDTGTKGGNLDINLELRDDTGALVASDNPVSGVNASISYSAPAGTYYLHVKPTGVGNPTSSTPTGYTSYASLGQYTVTGTIVPTEQIALTAPNGGGSTFRGFDSEITWLSGMGGNVKIELFKGGMLNSTIASGIPNNGSFLWTVPSGQAVGSDYRVKITSIDDPTKSDESISDFAINVPPAYAATPYSESFESGTGDWIQSTSDDLDWTHNIGSTVSPSTGPSSAQDGNDYLYTETSDPAATGDEAIITSWFGLDTVSLPELKFYYHMYGAAMGTLQVEISEDGVSWTTIFSQSGDKGDSWNLATVDLAAYEGKLIQLKIKGIRGTDFTSDMAIDNMSITGSAPTYTVVYSGNESEGGASPSDANNYTAGSTVTVLGNTGNLVRTGYAFSGWNTAANGSGTNYSPSDTFSMGSSNVTLYAEWNAVPTYTVSYSGNSNTGGSAPSNQTKTQTVDLTLAGSGSLTRTGYTFTGWNNAADGSGTSYAASGTYAADSAATMYAQWSLTNYTVTYDGNDSTGGSVPIDNNTYTYNTTATVLAEGNLTKFPYNFGNWNTSADGSGADYAANDTLSITGDVTLYAQWNPGPLAIYEPFDDANSSLSGNSPGVGLSGTWAGSGAVTSGSLNFGTLPTGSGNKASISNQNGGISLGNTLSTNGLLDDGTSLWFSVLVQTGSDIATNGDLGFALGSESLNRGNNLPIQNSGTAMGFTFKQNQLRASTWESGLIRTNVNTGNGANPNTLYLIIGKITWGASSETIEIYNVPSNMNLGTPVSTYTTAANIDQSLFDTISFSSKNAGANPHYIDEIRMGSTYEAVIGQGGPRPVDHFAISSITGNQSVGTPITGITITAEDSDNNTATDFTGTVTFGGTGGFTGTSANFTAGVLTGVSATPATAGSNLTLTVNDGSGHIGSTTITTIQSNYDGWSGSGGFTVDTNNDGIDNGIAWVLGATDTSINATSLLPVSDNTTDPAYFIYTFRRNDEAANDPNTGIAVQYGSDLSNWTTAAPSGSDIIITETDDGYGAGIDKVEVKIKRIFITESRLFTRLTVTSTP